MDNVLDILRRKNFVTKKRFGQNFITDANLLAAIADDAQITPDDTVVEVGAGAGTLTRALAVRAKRVIAYEIDGTLAPVLEETLSDLGNVEVVFADILKVKADELMARTGGKFKVVANLPYYVTSPVIFYFLENDFPLVSLTVMVQREVALRMTARHNTPNYGVLTLAVKSRSDAVITRQVSRKLFFPQPSVDSAVVRLDIKERMGDRTAFDKLVRCAFSCRRKTLANNLMQSFGYSRTEAEELLARGGVDPKARGESLDMETFVRLSTLIATR